MKATALLPLAVLPLLPGVHAEEPGTEAIEAPVEDPWIKPTLDIRARFEYGSIHSPALQSSSAFTVRERVGLITADWHGLSALVEGEFTQALLDSYDAGPGGFISPDNPTRTAILDPKNNELNQAYLQYEAFETTLRAGRQRIILDNAAFVGNVGWRQNEQTYDAVSIRNTCLDDLTLFYAYANRANRIFGADATGALRNFTGDMHFFNAAYDGLGDIGLAAYAYFMDFNKTAANVGYISNNTFGVRASGPAGPIDFHAEFAYQTDTGSSPLVKPDDAWYSHLKASCKLQSHALTLGYEYLDADFVTPLATVHAFNGYADAFIAPRIGLVRNPGIADLYLGHEAPLPFWNIKFSQTIHLLGDNNSNFEYGWEYDAVLSKRFDEHFLAIAKLAHYDARGPTVGPIANIAPFDTTRFSVELNYTY